MKISEVADGSGEDDWTDFADDDDERDAESEGDSKMLFGHADETLVASDHEDAVVWKGRESSGRC